MNGQPAWEFAHSVECAVSRHFAWEYWSDFANWNDPPAQFEFDGPFTAGTRITTTLPGQTYQSVIRDVQEGHRARIEMLLPEAVLSFEWIFQPIDPSRTRITQRLQLTGAGAAALAVQAKVLEQTTPDGMARLAALMERSFR